MFFWLSKKGQQEMIEEIVERQFENMRELLEDFIIRGEKRNAEQLMRLMQTQKLDFERYFRELPPLLEQGMGACVDQAIENGLKEMASAESVVKLEKELDQCRMQNKQMTALILELNRLVKSLKDAVEKLQAQVEDLNKAGDHMPPSPWTQFQPQPFFTPPVQMPLNPPAFLGEQATQPRPDPLKPQPEPFHQDVLERRKKPAVGKPSLDSIDDKARDGIITPKAVPAITPVFTLETAENRQILTKCMEQCGELKKTLEQTFGADKNFDIYRKLTERCQKKLEDLINKLDTKGYDSEKLAGETTKILSQTIVKALSHKAIHSLMEGFLITCGLRKIELPIGRKLTDKDYEYIDEPVLYEEVGDISMDNQILEVKQDAYVLDYIGEDGKEEAVITGIYKIGKFKNF